MRQKVTENLISGLMAFLLGLGRGLGRPDSKRTSPKRPISDSVIIYFAFLQFAFL